MKNSKVINMLIILFFLELFIGGGGRIFVIQSIPFRMIIFFTLFIAYLGHSLFTNKLYFDSLVGVIILYVLYMFLSTFIGILNGNSIIDIYDDIRPLIFILIYFPLYLFIVIKAFSISKIFNILKFSSIIISTFSIAIFILVRTGYFGSIYNSIQMFSNFTDGFEIAVRSDGGVFYTGHFYMMVGSLYSISLILTRKSKSLDYIIVLLSIIAMYFSSTRGILISFVFSIVAMVIFSICINRKNSLRKLVFLMGGLLIFFILYNSFSGERLMFDNWFIGNSWTIRETFIKEALDKISNNFLFGSGFGTSLPTKGTSHLEMSFIEILLDQGIIGLSIWGLLLYRIIKEIINAQRKEKSNIQLWSFTVIIFLFILTFTNPYINNPIGISLLLIVYMINSSITRVTKGGNYEKK